MNPWIQLKTPAPLFLTLLLLACFGLVPLAQAVLPAPDGGYPGANTAEGDNALLNVNTAIGINNTAVGANALRDNTTGGYNVAVGSGALASNTTGQQNMAIGTQALTNSNANFNLAIGFRVGFMNTTGNHLTGIGAAALRNNTTGSFNTAIGADALKENTTSSGNTAVGNSALSSNTIGNGNNAVGGLALFHNMTGSFNAALGDSALESNTSGDDNVAVGADALTNNFDGGDNTAVGTAALASNRDSAGSTAVGATALENSTGGANTALGFGALGHDTTGVSNTALGYNAGMNQDVGSNNVYIGAAIQGVAGESDTCRIKSIFGQTATNGSPVYITSSNKLGTDTSSKRFKDNIKPMGNASEALLALKPVTFRYKKEIDPEGKSQFGLVAEEVEKVNPDLIVRDEEGKPYSVRYDQVNAMLLNEFLKEHKAFLQEREKVEKLEATLAQQQKGMEVLGAHLKEQDLKIQKVSAKIEINTAGPGVVTNELQRSKSNTSSQ